MVHTDLLVCRDHIEISAAITVPSPPQADVLLVQGGAVEAAHIVDAGLGRLGGIPDQCGPLSLVELLHYCALIGPSYAIKNQLGHPKPAGSLWHKTAGASSTREALDQ